MVISGVPDLVDGVVVKEAAVPEGDFFVVTVSNLHRREVSWCGRRRPTGLFDGDDVVVVDVDMRTSSHTNPRTDMFLNKSRQTRQPLMSKVAWRARLLTRH